jgi:hypothetical protein
MHEPKVQDLDYINFLLATPRVVSATEAERVQPEGPRQAAHDAFTRLLHRLEPNTRALWQEAEPLIDRTRGLLVIDDSTLDTPFSSKIALVHRHWSGKHRRSCAASVQSLPKAEALDNFRSDALGVADSLVDGQVAGQIGFVNAAERAKEGPKGGVSAFRRIAVDFAYAIAVVVSRPLVLRVADGEVAGPALVAR